MARGVLPLRGPVGRRAADSDWEFSFRYFQDFEREIVLPDGFMPERIKIEVHSRTRSIDSIEESFSWATSLG